MKKIPLKLQLSAFALAAVMAGGTARSLAQTSQRPAPQPRTPERRFQSSPDRYNRSYDSRELRNLIEDLESSSPEEVRTGRIGRFFTDPAVIITDGRAHRIDWSRVRDRSNDRYNRDRSNDRYDPNRDDRSNRSDRDDRYSRRNTDVRIEDFETRRIDPRTVVVMYTAVFPGEARFNHQPVVATLVRESESRGWRVASYTAENAAIPGAADEDETDELPAR